MLQVGGLCGHFVPSDGSLVLLLCHHSKLEAITDYFPDASHFVVTSVTNLKLQILITFLEGL